MYKYMWFHRKPSACTSVCGFTERHINNRIESDKLFREWKEIWNLAPRCSLHGQMTQNNPLKRQNEKALWEKQNKLSRIFSL